MRAQAKVKSVSVTADTTLVTTAETAIATLGGVSNQSPDGIIRFLVSASVVAGASTTALTFRLRRGSGVTGTIVGEAVVQTLAATQTGVAAFGVEDAPGEVGGVTYTLTVQQSAATGNGTASYASVVAIS